MAPALCTALLVVSLNKGFLLQRMLVPHIHAGPAGPSAESRGEICRWSDFFIQLIGQVNLKCMDGA